MSTSRVVRVSRIEAYAPEAHLVEKYGHDLPLGRHVEHDELSRSYPHDTLGTELVSAIHPRRIGILDQGSLGSCTGNAAVGALCTEPPALALTDEQVEGCDERFAVAVYSAATRVDEFSGAYPPEDTGSSGLAVCKVLKTNHWIAGYEHTFSLDAALRSVVKGPVITGIPWYDSFDDPDESGLIKIETMAEVRGGHEVEIREIDVENRLVGIDNSWSERWGLGGRAYMSWDTWGQLLAESGDVTVLLPITSIPPVLPRATPADIALDAAYAAWRRTLLWP